MARAVLSTVRSEMYETIPDPDLLAELGKRVANARTYDEPAVKGYRVPADVPQPQRTDLEHQARDIGHLPFIDVELEAAPSWQPAPELEVVEAH